MGNSRLKFRVWDSDLQSYNNNPQYNVAINIDQTFGMVLVPFHNNIIEMCTGLKDKNGNLIYESDYIKDKWNNTTYLIKWVDAKFMCIDTEEMMPDTSPRQDWLDKCGFEIIGNIHEQAEQGRTK